MLFCLQAVENLIVRVICAHHSPRYKSCPHATLHLKTPRNYHRMRVFPGSSTVEHSAVNRRVASSNLARGAKFSFSFSQLQNVILTIHLWKSCHASVMRIVTNR